MLTDQGVERFWDLKYMKRLSKSCPELEDLDGSRSYQESIEHLESFSMDQATIKELSRMR